jgi:hypothetical protein
MPVIKRGDMYHLDEIIEGKRVRKSLKTNNLWLAEERAKEAIEKYKNRYNPSEVVEVPKAYVTKIFYAALHRANKKGAQFTLTKDDVDNLFARSGGRCEITGLPFSFENPDLHSKRPFVPSIDRIDCKGIYEAKNCRLICLAANVAINEWGERIFAKVARGFYLNSKLKIVE